VQDVKEVYVKDNEWFTESFSVQGKHVIIKINEKTVVDYTEPDNVQRFRTRPAGSFPAVRVALQGHDPNSKVHFKNIMVSLWPTEDKPAISSI